MPLATSVITLSTASITPAQEAFFGGQSYDLKTLPHEENIWLGEQLKQQQLLVDKLRKLLFDEPCVISSGIQKPKEETRENIKKSVLENLQKIGLSKEEKERDIEKLHRVGRFDHETQTQPIIVKFKTHSFKEKIYHQWKKLAKGIKISQSLTKQQLSDILQQVQHIIKEESSDDSPNKEESIVKFAFADVHRTLTNVLSKP